MSVDIKQLENAPEWIDEIGRTCSLEEASVIAGALVNENEAYDSNEIGDMVDPRRGVRSAVLREMEEAGVLESRGGMYYVDDKSKAKTLERLTD